MKYLALVFFILAYTVQAEDADDLFLHKATEALEITPITSTKKQLKFGSIEELGRALFFDSRLSGTREVSCATCHSRDLGSTDGNSLAIGIGGNGIGKDRQNSNPVKALLVPRNTLALDDRSQKEFTRLFWDGRVQVNQYGVIESPLGEKLPEGFEDQLAVAAVLPISEQDEMLGRAEVTSHHQYYHGGLITTEADHNYIERTLNVFDNIIPRLVGSENQNRQAYQEQYLDLFTAAYPNISANDFNITHVGNALAKYIKFAFALSPSHWDKYLSGRYDYISSETKQGAMIFLGKGRCYACHSGKYFTDMEFHSLAIPQGKVGRNGNYLDYGRAAATSKASDLYLFRTPPLRNVSKSSPYGHNGAFKDLDSIIKHHFNPIPSLFKAQVDEPEQSSYVSSILVSRSELLGSIAPLTNNEIRKLVLFLKSLDSEYSVPDNIAKPKVLPGDIKLD